MSTKSPRPERLVRATWSRRAAMTAGLGLPFLAACASEQHSESSDVLTMLRQSLDSHTGNTTVTRDQAAAIPYASIGVTVGSLPQTMLVLAAKSRATCLWTSAAHIAVETQSGRITRTAGLEHNMSQTVFAGRDPLQSWSSSTRRTYTFLMDIPDKDVYGASIGYEMSAPEESHVTILGALLSTFHVREKGSCSVLDWTMENDYWLDSKTGFVWLSRQNIHPDLDPIEIAVLRPPA
jgi:hypothetical protein